MAVRNGLLALLTREVWNCLTQIEVAIEELIANVFHALERFMLAQNWQL